MRRAQLQPAEVQARVAQQHQEREDSSVVHENVVDKDIAEGYPLPGTSSFLRRTMNFSKVIDQCLFPSLACLGSSDHV